MLTKSVLVTGASTCKTKNYQNDNSLTEFSNQLKLWRRKLYVKWAH